MSQPFVTNISSSLAPRLEQDLLEQGFELTRPPHTIFQAKKDGICVTLYQSFRLVTQGKKMKEFIEFYLEPEILESTIYTHKETLALMEQDKKPRIGADESGKGDFFGPLVVAAVYVQGEEDIAWLLSTGAKDSKLLDDKKIEQIASSIATRLPHETLILRPEKYNELYDSFGNLNHLLAWCHAQAITALSKRVGSTAILVDKFASSHVLENAVRKKLGSSELLEQRVRAEEDIAVAAASIIARATFVKELKKLEEKFACSLPKGASAQVIRAGEALIKKYDPDILRLVAKQHFSTTKKVLGTHQTT